MSLLQLSNVNVDIQGQPVLQDISLQLDAGSIVTVLGANGAGKTSLLRTISGIYPSKSGTIQFLDQPITKLPPHRIIKLSLAHAPEGRQIFGKMTVKENLILGARQNEIGLAPRPGARWKRSGWTRMRTRWRRICPMASARRWKLPARWRWSPLY